MNSSGKCQNVNCQQNQLNMQINMKHKRRHGNGPNHPSQSLKLAMPHFEPVV